MNLPNNNSIYNLGQLRQIIAQDTGAGVYNSTTGIYDFTIDTFPTVTRVNQMINDSIREICAYDYQCLEQIKSYPFTHVIQDVQSVEVFATGVVYTPSPVLVSGTATITPYPSDVLNYSWLADNSVQDQTTNYSGINCSIYVGAPYNVSVPAVSISGVATTAQWTGVGYNYQLDNDVDKLLNPPVWIARSNNNLTANGVFVQNIDFEDMMKLLPIGVVMASGTPQFLSTTPGLSNSNNNGMSIIFGPSPTAAYSGQTFLLFYKQLHENLVADTDQQQVIPLQFQNVITAVAESKVFALTNMDRMQQQQAYADSLVQSFKLWDWSQPSKVRRFRDANYSSSYNAAYDNSVYFRLGSMGH
jgi:hypothetical protein